MMKISLAILFFVGLLAINVQVADAQSPIATRVVLTPKAGTPCMSACDDPASPSCQNCCRTVTHETDWGCQATAGSSTTASCCTGDWNATCWNVASAANNDHACNQCEPPNTPKTCIADCESNDCWAGISTCENTKDFFKTSNPGWNVICAKQYEDYYDNLVLPGISPCFDPMQTAIDLGITYYDCAAGGLSEGACETTCSPPPPWETMKGCCRERIPGAPKRKRYLNHHDSLFDKMDILGGTMAEATATCKEACENETTCIAVEVHASKKTKKLKRNKNKIQKKTSKGFTCELHTANINSASRKSKACKKAKCFTLDKTGQFGSE